MNVKVVVCVCIIIDETQYTSNDMSKKELLEVEFERLSFAIILLSSSYAKIESVARKVFLFGKDEFICKLSERI